MNSSGPKDWLLDERLLQAQKLAAIGELSAAIAHEINNPLAVIRQEAEWLQQLLKRAEAAGFQGVEDFRDSLHEIVQQVDRCAEIIRNLLDFARKREPVLQAMDINGIIADMTRLVEREAQLKNIRIVRQYADDLPMIQSDAPQLRQVILNLLTNAVFAIGADGAVFINTRRGKDNSVQIAIRDTGGGIAPENLARIFDPFFTTKPEGQGTGLGLSICHGLVQRLGGRITVDSTPGRGTTFTITLPISPEGS